MRSLGLGMVMAILIVGTTEYKALVLTKPFSLYTYREGNESIVNGSRHVTLIRIGPCLSFRT